MQNLANYKSIAEDYLLLWNLEPAGEPFSTHSSFLWPVHSSETAAMLKIIVDPHDDEAHGAHILQILGGHGAVRLIQSKDNVQLLERVISTQGQPSLEQMVLNGCDDEATIIVCDVIDRLHAQLKEKELPSSYSCFSDRVKEISRHMDEGRVPDNEGHLFLEGIELSQTLMQEYKSNEILLHGDLHHFNILFSKERGWLAIDPKGILGPRAYEYAICLCNPALHSEIVANKERMTRQSAIISKKSGIPQDVLLKFTFAHAVQVAAWCLSKPDQNYWIACAKTARGLITLQSG